MREYYTHDELNFIKTLASGKSFLKNNGNSPDPRESLRKYASLVAGGFRIFDPGVSGEDVRRALSEALPT